MSRIHGARAVGIAVLAGLAAGALSAQASPRGAKRIEKIAEETNPAPEAVNEIAVIQTRFGGIEIEFFGEAAPEHVANFKKLARDRFFDGTTFHRVIPNFVIQGGDPNSKDNDPENEGQGGPGYTLPAEIGKLNKRGCVAAARLPTSANREKRSSGSQFYIALRDLPTLDQEGYTVFGRVIKGMDVVDRIAAVERGPRDRPVQPVTMTKVTIETR